MTDDPLLDVNSPLVSSKLLPLRINAPISSRNSRNALQFLSVVESVELLESMSDCSGIAPISTEPLNPVLTLRFPINMKLLSSNSSNVFFKILKSLLQWLQFR